MSIIQFTPDAAVLPSNRPGTEVSYRRWNGTRNVVLTGIIIGVISSVPRRSKELVYDYVISPCDPQYAHLLGQVVNEADIVWPVVIQ